MRLSQYKNYTFNSLVRFNGTFLGANNHGLFELKGSKDNTALIVSEFSPVMTDFGIINTKGLYYVYLGVDTQEDLSLTVKADNKPVKTYIIKARQSGQQTIRAKLGRSLYGRYWSFTISNPLGNTFAIDSIDVLPRIRNLHYV